MENQQLLDVYLNRVSAFLPNAPVSNDEMEAVLGMAGDVPSRVRKMILRSNGIESRHYAIDPATGRATHSGTELAAEAVKRLFEQGVDKHEISCLSCGTSYPDQIMPGQGVMLHGLLEGAPAYEVATAAGVCAAGMVAMKYAYNSVRTGEHGHAVAAASEAASAIMRGEVFKSEVAQKVLEHARPEIGFEKDFLRWMLSDGAGAAYLSNRPNPQGLSFKIRFIELVSYAHEMPVCMYAGAELVGGEFRGFKTFDAAYRETHSVMAVKQDVKLLNDNIVHYTVEKPIVRIMEKYGLAADEIDWFLPHYSSCFFRDKVAAGLEKAGFSIALEKWFTNLPDKGNTGSASIYIILEEFMRTFDVSHGQKVLCFVPESGRFSSCFMLLEAVKT